MDNDEPLNLQELNNLYGQETVCELLQMSVDEATGLMHQIRTGIEKHDSQAVMAGAHQLKGLASTMTINALAKRALDLETSAREESWDNIPEQETRLKGEFERMVDYISKLLSSPRK